MLNMQRGVVTVPRIDAVTRSRIEGQDVEFPVGEDLWDAIEAELERSPLSLAIKRYADAHGADLRDVIDAYAQQPLDSITVSRFLTNTGIRPLFSPVVEAGMRLGLERVAPATANLVARTVSAPTMSYEYYSFDSGVANPANPGQPSGISEFELRRVAQGAEIPVARVSISGKSYTLAKVGRGIEWTDESKAASIDLAAMWFQQVGLQIGWDLHDEIVDRLLNGYFPDNSDDPPVIATDVPAVIDDADLYKAVGLMEMRYGYVPTVMLMSLNRSIAIQTMENGAGQRLFPNGVTAAGLPPIQIAQTVPDDKIIFVDTGFAILRIENKPFGTEFERQPRRQIEGVYGTAIQITVPLFKNARVVLDA